MLNIRKKKEEEFKIDISALVDVLFTLLIFFSLTSTFINDTGLNINLPSASSSGAIVNQKKIYISIDKNGNIALDDKIVTLDLFKNMLTKIDIAEKMKYVVVLKADNAVIHGKVTAVMDLLKSNGFNNIAVATRNRK